MSCGCCPDPAAGGAGECCNLADTLAVGNETGLNDIILNPNAALRGTTVGAGTGGPVVIESGQGGGPGFSSGEVIIRPADAAPGVQGANASLSGGKGTSTGGTLFLSGGQRDGAGGPAGNVILEGGIGTAAGVNGGDAIVRAGSSLAGGTAGRLILSRNAIDWKWPAVDGLPGEPLTTDGAGNLGFGDPGETYIWSIVGNQGPAVTALGASFNLAGGPAGTAHATVNGNVYQRSPNIVEYITPPAPGLQGRASVSTGFLVVFGADSFDLRYTWGVSSGIPLNPLHECNVGLAVNNGVLTPPSAATQFIGWGWDSTDVNIQALHNDNAGTCTKVDTGIPKPTADRQDLYTGRMIQKVGSPQVLLILRRKSDGLTFTTLATTNLPVTNTAMIQRAQTSTGPGVNVTTGLGFSSMIGRRS